MAQDHQPNFEELLDQLNTHTRLLILSRPLEPTRTETKKMTAAELHTQPRLEELLWDEDFPERVCNHFNFEGCQQTDETEPFFTYFNGLIISQRARVAMADPVSDLNEGDTNLNFTKEIIIPALFAARCMLVSRGATIDQANQICHFAKPRTTIDLPGGTWSATEPDITVNVAGNVIVSEETKTFAVLERHWEAIHQLIDEFDFNYPVTITGVETGKKILVQVGCSLQALCLC